MKKLIALLLALTLLLSFASAEPDTGLLYRIEGGQNEMVILGSIHIGSEDMYPLGKHITDALADASTLVFECDTDSPEAMADTISLMYYGANEGKLDAKISPDCYALLEKAAEITGYPFAMLRTLKPWAIVSMFSLQTTAAEMGTDDIERAMELGIETQIKTLAGKEKKQAYLETAREQLEIMDAFSAELQEEMLRAACEVVVYPEDVSGLDSTLAMWPEWWKNGDGSVFADSYLLDLQNDPELELMQEYHEGLVTLRNRRMAEKLAEMLEDPSCGNCFVTIGLLHLVLPGDSVLSELEARGYTVSQILP